MNREKAVWMIVFLCGAIGLIGRAVVTSSGSAYVRPVEVHTRSKTTGEEYRWVKYEPAPRLERETPGVVRSRPRTIGIWLAAVLSLSALSFLYGDNVFLKITQALVVGVSAGYTFVLYYWSVIVPDLFGNLLSDFTRGWAMPGLEAKVFVDWEQRGVLGLPTGGWLFLIPLAFCVLLLTRLSPVGGWLSRWPLAFFIGVTAGTKLLGYFEADFVAQINNAIVPLVMKTDAGIDWGTSIKNMLTVACVLASLVYFFFSLEHRGALGVVARGGMCVLMITFGAMFALTVMTRITILSNQFEFLFGDWLWLM